jgi:phosphate uptake regulator
MLVRQEKERRKVQISGKSSCMVALPKKWVNEMRLQQGSEVMISKLNATSLLVNAQPDLTQDWEREAVIEVNTDDTPEKIFRKIVSLYVLGFNRITIEGSKGFLSPSKKLAIKVMTRRHLIGTEGVVESRDRMTVHVLLGYSELSVESALKKMLLIIDSLGSDSAHALENNDAVPTEAILDRQDEVGRFSLYVIRQLNLSLNQGVLPELQFQNRDTLGYILISRTLERIAYHASNLSKATGDLKKPLPEALVRNFVALEERACGLVDQAVLSLFKRDHEGADGVVERAKAFVGRETEVTKLLDESESETYYALHVLLDSQRRIAEYARDIAEIVLDMTVERTLQRHESEARQVTYA